MKQYASHLFPAPDLIGLLMDLNVPKLGFRHVSEYMSRRGSAYTAATGLPFAKPIPTREAFTDAWKELVTPLDLRPPVSIPDPPASGQSWPLPSWARYVQSRPSLVDTIDWTTPLTFIVRGDAYPCAGGSWTQLSIGLLNHGARGSLPLQSEGQNQKWPTCGQRGYVKPNPAASGFPTASERGAKSEVAHLWARWLRNPCRLGDPLRFRAGDKIRSGPLVGKVATQPLPPRGSPPLQSGGQNQKWPTCGQGGYVTPAVSGIPTASERGAKSEVAHLWARWLRNPCRLGDPHRFRVGGRIKSGAQKRAELLRNSCFLGDPQKGGIDMAHVGPGQKGLSGRSLRGSLKKKNLVP